MALPQPQDLVSLTYKDAWQLSGGARFEKTENGLENILHKLGFDESSLVETQEDARDVLALAGAYESNSIHLLEASDVFGPGRFLFPIQTYQEQEEKPGLMKRLRTNHPRACKALAILAVVGTVGLAGTLGVTASGSDAAEKNLKWAVEKLDDGKLYGADIDGAGKLHVVYGKDGQLLHSEIGKSVERDVVWNGDARAADIAIDFLDMPHILFFDKHGQLAHATLEHGNWSRVFVTKSDAMTNVIGIGANGPKTHVLYNDYAEFNRKGTLQYLVLENHGQDNTRLEYFVGGEFSAPSIAFDSSNLSHMVFMSNRQLKYYHDTGTPFWDEFPVENVEAKDPIVQVFNNTPYVVYADYTNRGDLKFAKLNGKNWEIASLKSDVSHSSFVIDESGRPHIAFSNGIISYGNKINGSWTFEPVDTANVTKVGLQLDRDNKPHIVYESDGAIKHAMLRTVINAPTHELSPKKLLGNPAWASLVSLFAAAGIGRYMTTRKS